MMGDYNLVMAPLYHWWERMQQKYRESDEREGTEHTMWNHLGSCASLTKSRRQRRESHVDIDNIGILISFTNLFHFFLFFLFFIFFTSTTNIVHACMYSFSIHLKSSLNWNHLFQIFYLIVHGIFCCWNFSTYSQTI